MNVKTEFKTEFKTKFNYMEQAITFENNKQKLYGILHEPERDKKPLGLIFLHGWGTYRIGPHRFFVDAAREFGKAGFASLRFDFRGRGESEGSVEETTLLDMIDDTHRAIEEMLKGQEVKKIILIGLCSGGEVAVGTAAENQKVNGVVLLSTPLLGRVFDVKEEVKKTANYAKTYWQKLFLAKTWKKVFSFRVNYKAIFKILFGKYSHKKSIADKPPREAELIEKFKNFKGKSLFIYGGNDPLANPSEQAYREYCKAHEDVKFATIPGANHNFYSIEWKKEVLKMIQQWLEKV